MAGILMETLWKYAMTCVVTNPVFATTLYGVLMDSLPEGMGSSADPDFSPDISMRDTTQSTDGPHAWVIHSPLQQAQYDEVTEYLAGGTPLRWLDAGLLQTELDAFRTQQEINIGPWEQIGSEHAGYMAARNLVPMS